MLGSLSKDVKGFIKGFYPDKEVSQEKEELVKNVIIDKNELALTGIYEYVYPHNTKQLNENHYLEFKEGYLYYYGTSDDFDIARDGYLPGYFFTRVKEVILQNDKIDFKVKVDHSLLYKYQISPLFRTEHNEHCEIDLTLTERFYKGALSKNKDTIVVNSDGLDTRLFVRLLNR